MIEDPEFVTHDEVLELHQDATTSYGGDPGIRDAGLLDAAIAMPRQSFGGQFLHGDLFAMAAYAFHIAESQAFVDGNKRTGLAAAYAFLALNGYRLKETRDRLYQAILAIGTHELDKAGLAEVFRECATIERDD